jgi:hypothetical protein
MFGVTVILIIPEFKLADIVAISDEELDTVPNSVIFWFVPSKTIFISVLLKYPEGVFEI